MACFRQSIVQNRPVLRADIYGLVIRDSADCARNCARRLGKQGVKNGKACHFIWPWQPISTETEQTTGPRSLNTPSKPLIPAIAGRRECNFRLFASQSLKRMLAQNSSIPRQRSEKTYGYAQFETNNQPSHLFNSPRDQAAHRRSLFSSNEQPRDLALTWEWTRYLTGIATTPWGLNRTAGDSALFLPNSGKVLSRRPQEFSLRAFHYLSRLMYFE